MSYEAELGDAVGAAAVTGNIGALVTGIGDLVDRVTHEVHIANATSGSVTADLHVMASFYNSLSDLHAQLRAKMAALKGQALDVHDRPAAGHVAGVQKAWRSIAESAGVMQHDNSLYGNLLAIDHWVQYYMGAVMENVQKYAEHERMTIQSFGRASDANVPVPTRTPAGSSASTGTNRPASGAW